MKRLPFLTAPAMLAGMLTSGCHGPADAPARINGEPLTMHLVERTSRSLESALVQILEDPANRAVGGMGRAIGAGRTVQPGGIGLLEHHLSVVTALDLAIRQQPAAERAALLQGWDLSRERVRELAETIVSSSPVAADAYGPVLAQLVERMEAAPPGRSPAEVAAGR